MSSDKPVTAIGALRAASGLGSAAGTAPRQLVSRDGLSIDEEIGLPVTSLRRSRIEADGAWLQQQMNALGLALPDQPQQISGDANRACARIEPHRWLVTGAADPGGPPAKGWLVTDVSSSFSAFRLTGARAIDVLASGGNMHGVEPGTACRLPFAETLNVLIQRFSKDEFRLLADVSYAPFVADWLTDAAANQFPG